MERETKLMFHAVRLETFSVAVASLSISSSLYFILEFMVGRDQAQHEISHARRRSPESSNYIFHQRTYKVQCILLMWTLNLEEMPKLERM